VDISPHLAQLLIVVTGREKKFEGLFVTEDGSPG
jgi:hypothetical protein